MWRGACGDFHPLCECHFGRGGLVASRERNKLWLSAKESLKASKRDKDRRQGDLLLDAVARNMRSAYPLDLDFVLALPEDLLPVFNAWADRHGYVPAKSAAPDW